MLTLQSLYPSATAETPCQRLVASPVARPLIEALDYGDFHDSKEQRIWLSSFKTSPPPLQRVIKQKLV